MGKPSNPAVLNDYARKLIRTKARQLVQRAGFSRSDRSDVEQDLVLRLLERSRHFDVERASLNTFIARVIDSCVVTLLRERGRSKRAAGYRALSLEAPIAPGGTASLRDLLTAAQSTPDHELVDALRQAMATLPAELRALCAQLPDRRTGEIAREFGMSRQRLYRAIAQIRAHFRQAGLGEF